MEDEVFVGIDVSKFELEVAILPSEAAWKRGSSWPGVTTCHGR
ncbi:MAG TPA: hypothetical protein VMB26_02215 [Candidatus Binataceae bacterium]|nr:hypothetical protein [Candidatus Binataceae bacterium]